MSAQSGFCNFVPWPCVYHNMLAILWEVRAALPGTEGVRPVPKPSGWSPGAQINVGILPPYSGPQPGHFCQIVGYTVRDAYDIFSSIHTPSLVYLCTYMLHQHVCSDARCGPGTALGYEFPEVNKKGPIQPLENFHSKETHPFSI